MKRFLILFAIFFCANSFADTETINWYVDNQTYTTTCEIGGDINLPETPYKKGYTFQGWKTYTRVEYIQSNGSNFINTKTSQFVFPLIETKFQMMSYGDLDWFGTAASSNYLCWNFDSRANAMYFRYGNSNSRSVTLVTGYSSAIFNFVSAPHTLKIDYNGNRSPLYVDNTLVAYIDTTNSTFYGSGPIYIGKSSRGGAPARWYSFKISNYDGTELFYGLPVIDENGVPGMFDTVSHTIFYGTNGDFSAGPVLN